MQGNRTRAQHTLGPVEEATFSFVYLGFLIVVAGQDTNTHRSTKQFPNAENWLLCNLQFLGT